MSINCSSCNALVEREDCHKNRYGEYICKKCQGAGVRFTRAHRLLYLQAWWEPRRLFWLTVTVVAVLVLLWFYFLLPELRLYDFIPAIFR